MKYLFYIVCQNLGIWQLASLNGEELELTPQKGDSTPEREVSTLERGRGEGDSGHTEETCRSYESSISSLSSHPYTTVALDARKLRFILTLSYHKHPLR